MSDVNSGDAVIGTGKTTWVFFVCKQYSWYVQCDEYVTPNVLSFSCLHSSGIYSSLCRVTVNYELK